MASPAGRPRTLTCPAPCATSWLGPRPRQQIDPRYGRNVEALRRVQPADLAPSDITARLGAPWVPADVVELFSREVIGIATTIRHTVEIAAWTVDKRVFAGQAAATSEWGTARRHAGELLDDALHSSIPTIWDIWRDTDGEHREINAAETEAAKEKLAKIKTAFEGWTWTDAERTEQARPHLQRHLQQFGATPLRRLAPAATGRQLGDPVLCPPEAGDLAHHRCRARPTWRTRSGAGQDLLARRGNHGAAPPGADFQGDDGGARDTAWRRPAGSSCSFTRPPASWSPTSRTSPRKSAPGS